MYRIYTLVVVAFLCSTSIFGQTQIARNIKVSDEVIALANEWVETWNRKDLAGMRRLHADDISRQLYGMGEGFSTVEKLFDDIASEKWWGLSWSIQMVEPRVRLLGSDSALVTGRLVGKETNSSGSRPYSGGYSFVFHRQKNVWKIVHVHSSHGKDPE